MSNCEACGRDTGQRTCPRCAHRAAHNLTQILALTTAATQAAGITMPSKNPDAGHSGKPGSRPPLNLATLDPENTSLDQTRTILTMLETWAVAIRHARSLTPYGIASLAATLHGNPPLTTLIKFHQTQLDWSLYDHSPLNVPAYLDDLEHAHKCLKTWDTNKPQTTYRLQCPADADNLPGLCRAPLTLTQDDVLENHETRCRHGHTWTARRLLAVANTTNVDVWLTAPDLAHHLGLHERTIRKWARAGYIRKQGDRYSWNDAKVHGNSQEATG